MYRHGLLIGAVIFIVLGIGQGCQPTPLAKLPSTAQTEFVYCHWNVENFFDDKDDNRTGPGDREYDALYSEQPDLLRQKLAKLTDAILKMNAGKGPDILSIVEVESTRAAELLQKSLNARLDESLHYKNVVMKEVSVGRHIAPAILTRLNVVKDRTQILDKQRRILVCHLTANDHDLVVVASHWTSRLKDSGIKGRTEYADKIYGAVNAMFRSNPGVDVLISGDFNDDPDDDSVVNHLHATGNREAVRSGGSLQLFNLFAGKNPQQFGTHYYRQWHMFDQIVVSPGMLETKGWSCDPQTLHVFNELHRTNDKQKRPWRFGGPNEKTERGYSDHFPVLIKLRIESH